MGEISNCLYARGKGPKDKILLKIKIEGMTDGAQFPKREQSVHARVWMKRERTGRDTYNSVVWKGRGNEYMEFWQIPSRFSVRYESSLLNECLNRIKCRGKWQKYERVHPGNGRKT